METSPNVNLPDNPIDRRQRQIENNCYCPQSCPKFTGRLSITYVSISRMVAEFDVVTIYVEFP